MAKGGIKARAVRLHWPLRGLHTGRSYELQPPYSTVDALNVRPDETIEGRERGGSRPGLVKAFNEQLGSGNPVRGMCDVTVVTTDGFTVWADTFDRDTLGSLWTTAAWVGAAPSICDDTFASVTYDVATGAVYRTAISDLDTTQAFEVGIYITPYKGAFQGKYGVYVDLNATTPDYATSGVFAYWQSNSALGGGTVHLASVTGGVTTTYTTVTVADDATLASTPGWFTVLVTGTNLKVYWKGTQYFSQTVIAATARMGFYLSATEVSGIVLCDTFRVQYYKASGEAQRRLLTATSNGLLYEENRMNQMAQVVTNTTLASGHHIQGVEHLQKVYWGDYDVPVARGTNGVFTSATVLTSATYPNWTTAGVDADDHVVVVTNATGATVNGTYRISTVGTGDLTLLDSAGGSGGCTFRIERQVKIHDPVAATLTLLHAAAGQAPTGCPCIAAWRSRIVLAGGNNNPHVWSMSRVDDPLDWNFQADENDARRAITGSTSEFGQVGQPVKALAPHSDMTLILGCMRSLWAFQGDPAFGGQLMNKSHDLGIIDKGAWCRGPADELIFMSHKGLAVLPAGSDARPELLSEPVMPRRLKDIDTEQFDVLLCYDGKDNGVHIMVTAKTTGMTVTHYWYDWSAKGFWPATYQSDHEPCSIIAYTAQTPDESGVLYGCRDGYIRRHYQSAATDDGYGVTSYCCYGPMPLGDGFFTGGIVGEMQGVLGVGSGDVTWGIHVADSHEAAAKATAFITGTWVAGLNYRVLPNAYGGAWMLKMTGAATNRAWSAEAVSAVLVEAGPLEKR